MDERTTADDARDHPFPKLMDLLGRRWALRILHELHAGSLGFRELAARCGGMSSSVLSTRLSELRVAGIIEHDDKQYHALTPRGRELTAILTKLSEWAVEA